MTDFLQQAHAADESYTVRDGVNIARYALKLKSETGQPRAFAVASRTARGAWGRSASLRCGDKRVCGLKRARRELSAAAISLISRWCPGASSLPCACGVICWSTARASSPSNCHRLLRTSIARRSSACRRCRSSSFRTAAADEEDHATYIPVEPGDPFIEALRTAREIDAEVVFLEPRDTREAAPHRYLSGAVLAWSSSAWSSTWRPIAFTRSRARRRSKAHAAAMAGSCRARIRWHRLASLSR